LLTVLSLHYGAPRSARAGKTNAQRHGGLTRAMATTGDERCRVHDLHVLSENGLEQEHLAVGIDGRAVGELAARGPSANDDEIVTIRVRPGYQAIGLAPIASRRDCQNRARSRRARPAIPEPDRQANP
jgi:hypothetical protein